MRDSADSDDYGVTRPGRGGNGKKRGKFYDDESAFAKRDRHLPRLEAEDARDDTDGLPEGDRWSTWDQSETPISSELFPGRSRSQVSFRCLPGARRCTRPLREPCRTPARTRCPRGAS